MTDNRTTNRTTELRISEPLRGFIRHQTNRAYIDSGQTRWLTKIADEIDEQHKQAIADELNATVGNGTCELAEVDSYKDDRETIHVLECSACGETCEHVNGSYPRCPHCGKAVKR